MRTRKNIDKLYQERLNNVGTTPPEDLWKNIAARLPEKERKKRLIPYWYRLAGVAAILGILVGVGDSILRVPADKSFSSTGFPYNTNNFEGRTRINPVSTYFKENMNSSVILLEALMKVTENEIEILNSNNSKPNIIQHPSQSKNTLLSDIISFPTEILLTDKYTFNDFNNAAFIEEEENRVKLDVDEFQKITQLTEEEDESFNDEAITSSLSNRLSIKPTVGAVYFDNMGSGNIINSQFDSHESKGDVSLAYGINLAYQISNKVQIRSGISKVVFSHNTQGIDYPAAVSAIAVNSAQPLQGAVGERDNELSLVSHRIPGELNQHMDFIEVPLEIEYALITRQIVLNIIAGASTLFLNRDMVTLKTTESSGNIGEANNLNDLSFSTNIGIGIDYNISPRLQLNLEPIFKYQLNTFNLPSDIQPYNFGVYSGIQFKF